MQNTAVLQTLQAPTTPMKKPGFFGLHELHRFFKEDVEKKFESTCDCQLILDFSNVIYWDISALLWLVIALHHFQQRSEAENKSVRFRLRLPQPTSEDSDVGEISSRGRDLLKSADYLRRWRFTEALRNLTDDPNELLVTSQKGYLDGEPRYYYPRMVTGPSGLIEQLISVRLVEVRNLVDFSTPAASRQVKRELVEARLREFIDHAVVPILSNQCGIEMDVANMFVTHLLLEGLENMLQHPNATVGMFSISRIGPDKLVLAIADNGDSICETIYEHYRHTQGNRLSQLPAVYPGHRLDAAILCDLIVHAAKEGVSRKWSSGDADWQEIAFNAELKRRAEIGMGLTHIRDATVGTFKGNLIVATEGVSVTFKTTSKNSQKECLFEDVDFQWPGNLLRIQIPVKERLLTKASSNR